MTCPSDLISCFYYVISLYMHLYSAPPFAITILIDPNGIILSIHANLVGIWDLVTWYRYLPGGTLEPLQIDVGATSHWGEFSDTGTKHRRQSRKRAPRCLGDTSPRM